MIGLGHDAQRQLQTTRQPRAKQQVVAVPAPEKWNTIDKQRGDRLKTPREKRQREPGGHCRWAELQLVFQSKLQRLLADADQLPQVGHHHSPTDQCRVAAQAVMGDGKGRVIAGMATARVVSIKILFGCRICRWLFPR